MKKQVILFAVMMLMLVLICATASAAVTISGIDTVDFQIGLPTERPAGGGFFSRGESYHYAINDNPTDNMYSTIRWSVTPTNGGPAMTITADGEGRFSTNAWLNLDPAISYTAGGPYTYNLAMDINGSITSRTITVNFVSNPLPTGWGLTVAPVHFTDTSASLGTAVSVANNEMYMVSGNTYVVTAGISGTTLGYMMNERAWGDTEWEELYAWNDSRLGALNVDTSNSGIYKAKKMGTYDHSFVVHFYSNNGSNLSCYIPYTLYVTDAQGNLPALKPELSGWNYSWADRDDDEIDFTIYTGLGISPEALVWNDSDIINFHLENYDDLFHKYGGEPVWSVSQSGDPLDYRVSSNPDHIWATLNEMPSGASETTVTVTCSWGGETTTKKVHVHAVHPNFTFPTGLEIPNVDANGVCNTQEGQIILFEPQIQPGSWAGVPGFSPAFFCANGLWDFAQQDWNYQSGTSARYNITKAGIYQDVIGLSYGALMVTKQVTFKVADQSGNIPGPELDNSGEVWTYYTGLSDTYPMQGGVYGTDTIGQFRIPDGDRNYALADPVWSMVHISGPDCFELNDNSEHYGGNDINYIRSLSVKGTVTTGTARYKITAAYNGLDYTADVIVNIENPASVPTGMTLRIAEFDETNLTTGAYTTIRNGEDLTLETGKAYVLEGNYIGTAPGSRDNQWLNFSWNEGWQELDRWSYRDSQGNELFKGFNMVIQGGTPGIYEGGASLTIGMSNLEAAMPLTLKVADASGNIPAPAPQIHNNRNGTFGMNFYLGMRYVKGSFFIGEVQTEPQIDHFYVDNEAQMAAEYPNDEATWKLTKVSGTAELEAETNQYYPGMDLVLDQLPAGPETAVWKIECDWGSGHWETNYTIQFMYSPTGLPDGIEMDFGNVLVVKSGDRLGLADKVRFRKGWNIPGEIMDTTIGGVDNWQDAVTHNGDWIWDVADKPGVYNCNVSKLCGNVRWIENFTLIVTEADGTLNKNLYTPIGTVWQLPANITKIESEAFAGTKLTEIDIPAGTQIEANAFAGTGLVAVYTHNDPDTIQWAVSNGVAALTD